MHQPTAPLRRIRHPSSTAAVAPLVALISLIASSVVVLSFVVAAGPISVALGLSAMLAATAVGLYTMAANQYVALAQPARIEPVRTRGIKEVF